MSYTGAELILFAEKECIFPPEMKRRLSLHMSAGPAAICLRHQTGTIPPFSLSKMLPGEATAVEEEYRTNNDGLEEAAYCT